KSLFLDFLDLIKPKLMLLVTVTAGIGFLLSERKLPFFDGVLSIILIGLSVASACTLNCYLEKDVDKLMDRTKNRPLPAGRLAPKSALIFGLVLLFISIIGLTWITNFWAALLTLSSACIYLF